MPLIIACGSVTLYSYRTIFLTSISIILLEADKAFKKQFQS